MKTLLYGSVITAIIAGGFYSPLYAAKNEDKALQNSGLSEKNVFLLPQVNTRLKSILAIISQRRLKDGEKALEQLIAQYPWHMESHYILASLLAIQGKKDTAFQALTKAIDLGFANHKAMKNDNNLASLRTDALFSVLLNKAEENAAKNIKTMATAPKKGLILVEERNTTWNRKLNALVSSVRIPKREYGPVITQKPTTDTAGLLNKMYREGRSAGNTGDIYDNRDRGHSRLKRQNYPQLTFTRYSDKAKKVRADYGLGGNLIFTAPTFGNSSTAVTGGVFSRSLPRFAYTSPGGASRYFIGYAHNHLYAYPAIEDYTIPGVDKFPVNSPYFIISRGRSYSDKPVLEAIATILAAFKPETKDQLIRSRLLMPTVQSIFRQGQKHIVTRADYLSGKAHPVAFSTKNIDLSKMIKLANALEFENVAPLVYLTVLEESKSRDGVDNFSRQLPEKLSDSPASIVRIIRNSAFEKRLVIEAKPAGIKNTGSLKYHWIILQGNKRKISITPKDAQATAAEIKVGWHSTFRANYQKDVQTHRVDIAVIADNGENLSAPSIISLYFPPHQQRFYTETGQLLAIDHRNQLKAYMDPRLFPKRDWRDDYSYDQKGNLTGWIRTRGNKKTEFSRHGAKILTKDDLGRPIKAQQVGYLYSRDKAGRIKSQEKLLNSEIEYQYLDENDRLGILVQ
ncbi:MAG: hypothetical protein MI743_17280 [Sneathiellales bacterium]|nr:hypothetical protein [Sneathiellales bacterium]